LIYHIASLQQTSPKPMRIIYLILVFLASVLTAQTKPDSEVRIGTIFDYPASFFLENRKQLNNINHCEKSLLSDIEQALDLRFTCYTYDNKTDLLLDLEKGQIDMAIGDINLSPESIKNFYASHPYNICPTLLIGHEQEKNNYFLILFKSIFTVEVLQVILLFFIITFVFAHSIWFFEHKKQSDLGYRASYKQFFAESFWIAFNTNGKMNIGSPLPMRASWINRFFSFFIWLFTSVSVAFIVYNINIELAKNSSYNEVAQLQDLTTEHEILVLKNNPELALIAQKTKAKLSLTENYKQMSKLLAQNPNAYILIKENNLGFFNQQKPKNLETKTCHNQLGINKIVILYNQDFYLKNFGNIVNTVDYEIEKHLEGNNFSSFFKP
jgi:Bacterial extracellular solute-binding proteins, family 3